MGKRKSEELLSKIALRIKELREEKGLTQENFYNDTGIHIGRIETLKRNISITTIEDVCKYFNISISEFFKEI
jgi:transcriptional regulator with XRE-family HTH domain